MKYAESVLAAYMKNLKEKGKGRRKISLKNHVVTAKEQTMQCQIAILEELKKGKIQSIRMLKRQRQ